MTNNNSDHSITTRHILLLGGAGYLGSVLARRLLQLKYTVTIFDNFLYGSGSLDGLDRNDFFCVIEGDIRDYQKMSKVMPGKNIVINLAAIVGDAACDLDPESSKEINANANNHLFKIANNCGVERFLYASTCSVYGCANTVLKEDSFLYPVSLYAQTKLASELFLLALVKKSSTSLTILRFATMFGWSQRPRFDLVVNTMTSTAISHNKVTVFGGNQWRPHLHIRDAAEAIVRIIEAEPSKVNTEIFNVGGNQLNMTIADLGRKVAESIPGCRLEENREAEDPRNYRVDFAKIVSSLDFIPRYSITDGIREIYGNFMKGNISSFTKSVYSNVKFLEKGVASTAAIEKSIRPTPVPARESMEIMK